MRAGKFVGQRSRGGEKRGEKRGNVERREAASSSSSSGESKTFKFNAEVEEDEVRVHQNHRRQDQRMKGGDTP